MTIDKEEDMLEPGQEKMFVELWELRHRLHEMHEFIGNRENTDSMDLEKLDLLMKQYHYMSLYEHVLMMRCNLEGINLEGLG